MTKGIFIQNFQLTQWSSGQSMFPHMQENYYETTRHQWPMILLRGFRSL